MKATLHRVDKASTAADKAFVFPTTVVGNVTAVAETEIGTSGSPGLLKALRLLMLLASNSCLLLPFFCIV